jgi:hypothetical protein
MSEHQPRSSGGTDTTDVARQEGRHVKGTAKDAASNVADTAAARGRQITGQAKRHARSIAGDAQRQLRSHAREETQRAGAALSTAGDQLRALADGRVDEAGVLGSYVEAAADAVNRWADIIQDRGLDGLLDDLRAFGRHRPGMFLAGALAAGIVAGRFGRNAAQELGDTDTSAHAGTAGTAARDRSGGDDMIVGHASDDSAVVVSPGGATDDTARHRPVAPPRDADDVAYRAVDVDEERAR